LLRCSGGDVIGASLVVARRGEAGPLALDFQLALVVLAADLGAGLLVFIALGDVRRRWLVGRRWHLVRVIVVEPGLDPLFLGQAGAGWVEAANQGFVDAVKGSAVKVLAPKFGDTGKEVQLKLVEDEMQANPNIRYIAGTAVTAEAAQGLIRERGLQGKVDLLAFYMTPGVYEGIKRGFILAAPADSMVIQGRIAIDQAVRILEGKEFVKHVGPKIFVVDPANVNDVPQTNILPPDGYAPVFSVN